MGRLAAGERLRMKRPKRRTVMVGFRLTPEEWRKVEAHRRPDEVFSECARRLLLHASERARLRR